MPAVSTTVCTGAMTEEFQMSYYAYANTTVVRTIEESLDSQDRIPASMKEQNEELRDEVANLKKENAILKAYLCEKDPAAPFCN